jgi:uncharacterized membrane protein YhaH (DUF805 family)
MNNLIQSYVGFDGRINRQRWWIGIVVLIIVGLVLNWILGMIMGTGGMMDLSQALDPATMQKMAWQGLIVGLITAYPYLALSIKRRHDRDNNGYDAAGLIALSLVFNLLQALGIVSGMAAMNGGFGLGSIIGLLLAVYGIYMLVQLGFLKGTAGPNSYGPDPLQG